MVNIRLLKIKYYWRENYKLPFQKHRKVSTTLKPTFVFVAPTFCEILLVCFVHAVLKYSFTYQVSLWENKYIYYILNVFFFSLKNNQVTNLDIY